MYSSSLILWNILLSSVTNAPAVCNDWFISVIEIVKERLNPNLSIGGIVITQFDKRKTLNKSVAEIINDSFCDKVFKTIVRDNVALAEAPIKGKNVFEYNKNCNGAKDYIALAQEVLKLK